MPLKHIVREGDCLASIAYANGFAIDTIWNHSSNDALRQLRTSPFQLVPGDEVTIPDRVPKVLPRKTGKCHVFRRRNVPEMVTIRLYDAEKRPRADLPYVLVIEGKRFEGTTDAEGRVQHGILPSLPSAQLIIGDDEIYELATGFLLPESEDGGVSARLAALGYLFSDEDGQDPVLLADALRSFQTDEQLTASGAIDDATRAKLKERYGS